MEEEEGGARLSKRLGGKEGEVDYKTKSGTAWSHSYLNQKPWHPLSYPNQRRKWIAEQTHAQHSRRAEEVAREYAQEQEFLRQTSLLSQKEKEKVDIMQAVSFMYVRPPGYNAESAKAAEIADERSKFGESDPTAASSSVVSQAVAPVKEEKKKPRPKDVFGRTLPTEEEFAVLKNAPRLETGVTGRVKPFAVEVRNVKCVRCGNFGHQSGDRECPLKDAIMPNDENRLKRDDPLTAIVAHMDSAEPLKWELKQRPGISPPRGGFMPDDPNQQIVAEDIFDEYGGFLSGGGIPEVLNNIYCVKHEKSKSQSKLKKQASSEHHEDGSYNSESGDGPKYSKTELKRKRKHKKPALSTHGNEETDSSSEDHRSQRMSRRKERLHKSKKMRRESTRSCTSEGERYDRENRALPTSNEENNSTLDNDRHRKISRREKHSYKRKKENKDLCHSSSTSDSEDGRHHGMGRYKHSHHYIDSDKHRKRGLPRRRESKVSYENSSSDGERKSRKGKVGRHHKTTRNEPEASSSENSEQFERLRDRKNHKRSYSMDKSSSGFHQESRRHRQPHNHHSKRRVDSTTRK